jgi:hypothetical protein
MIFTGDGVATNSDAVWMSVAEFHVQLCITLHILSTLYFIFFDFSYTFQAVISPCQPSFRCRHGTGTPLPCSRIITLIASLTFWIMYLLFFFFLLFCGHQFMRTKMQKYAKNAKICKNCKTHKNVLKPLEISFFLGLRLRLGLMHCQEEFGGWKTLWDFCYGINWN